MKHSLNKTETFLSRLTLCGLAGFLLCMFPLCLSAQSSGQNYIVTTVPFKPVTDPTKLIDVNSGSNSNTTIQYFDGLGRPSQTVQQAITPSGADLVTGIMYDSFGRDSLRWQPAVAGGNNGAYYPNYATQAVSSNGDAKPYSQTEYETSPLNRVTGQYGAGVVWYNAGKKKSIEYTINGSDVKYFYVDGTTLKCDGTYTAGTLYGQKNTDEDGKIVEEFTDKLGRKVLSRVASVYDTYYVYDDLNNLRYVLPPLAADALSTNTTGFDESAGSTLGLYGYIYHYDGLKRCTEKKLPGCDWIYMVYDRADRLILSQDGNQRAKSPAKWTVTKYDILGRVLYTGLINSTNSRATMESTYSGSVTPESYTGSGAVAGYTSSNLTPVCVLIVNYYDNYSFLSYSGNNPGSMLTSTTLSGYDNPAATAYAKTLLTGTRVYHLDNPSLFETTALYYDKYGRVVQTRSNNHLGGYDITYNALDFRGKVSSTRKEHNISGQAVIPEVYTYSYDKAERLTTTNYQLNNNTTITPFTNYKYDELGRLVTNFRHNATDTVSYLYNIRNWTTKIKSGAFEENLYYNTNPMGQSICFNGNISVSSWKYGKVLNQYVYNYDGLNRLTQSTYCSGNITNPPYHESFTYDKQGNITLLSRTNSGTLTIDNLTLKYSGNQVINVSDPAGSQHLASVKEYQNLSTATNKTEFYYDKNGNMTSDSDRNIVAIRYNILNLPDTIQFGTGNQIINSYAADGRKLGTEYFTRVTNLAVPLITGQVNHQTYTKSAINQNGTAYVDNKEYTTLNGNPALMTLNRILNSEGYVNNLLKEYGAMYCYNRKDHLGNIREVWQAAGIFPSATGQRTQYYPSGLPWAITTAADYPSMQPYKFNGKQFDEMHGYDTYDYGARGYYAAMGRFTTVDPLAEKYYSISPYAYCAGNPVNRIDIDGKEIYFIVRNSNGNVTNQLSYHNGNFWHENGSRYNPGKESLSKSLYKTLASYRGIEKSGDKVLIHELKTLETSKKVHFVEEGNERKSYVVPYDGSDKGVQQTDEMVKNGTPVGTQTILDFSDEAKKTLSDNNKGIKFSDVDQVTHEMQHQYDDDQGTNTDSGDHSAKDPAEIRGVKNENRERKREGEQERSTYGGEEIDPNKLK